MPSKTLSKVEQLWKVNQRGDISSLELSFTKSNCVSKEIILWLNFGSDSY